MKIAFLNPQGNFDRADSYLTEHPDFGGQLVYVKELALALAGQGIEVDIITRRIEDPDWSGFEAGLDDFGQCRQKVRIVRIGCGGPRFLAKERLWPHLPEMVDNLLAFYGDDLPDAMTAHYADGGFMGAILHQRTGLPFTFTGHSLGAQKLERLGADPENFAGIDQRYRFSRRIAAERLAMRRAGRIITSTRGERLEQYGHALYRGAVDPADDRRFAVVAPGINELIFNSDAGADDARFAAALRQRFGAESGPAVLSSSRLDEKKNVAGLVDAWLLRRDLQQRARLVLFVRGIDDPFGQLHRLRADEQRVLGPILDRIAARELQQRVLFINAGSQRQLATAYRYFAASGSVFALPSLYEPFGLAPVEAAACGLAVVATRYGGPAEVFADGAGILVEPVDPDDMADGLLQALANHDQLVRIARRRVSEHYTWKQTANGYLKVVESLGRGRPERANDSDFELDASRRILKWLRGRPAPR